MDRQEILRTLPRVDDMIEVLRLKEEAKELPYSVLLEQTRAAIDQLRTDVSTGKIQVIPANKVIEDQIISSSLQAFAPALRTVINATGVILHTNLGRAVLAPSVAQDVKNAAGQYTTLEYSLQHGARGSRGAHIEELLCKITGAQAAMAVNNNAAAVLLILSSLCKGKEVIVSRGELVEIGGSFRVPEIMSQSGAILKEVGTTNKTKLSDYEGAVDKENTVALLKVHTSNFKIVGFSQQVDISTLAGFGKSQGLPTIYDLGSGLLTNEIEIENEISALDCIKAGADIVCFSGDKLLGGPQAGVIIGEKQYIDKMKSHPLYRTMRMDKLCLAALESTLRLYLDPQKAIKEIPLLRALSMTKEELKSRADQLLHLLPKGNKAFSAKVSLSNAQVGGGSAPGELLPSYVVEIMPLNKTAAQLEQDLRSYKIPIISRIHKDRVLLDTRTIFQENLEDIANAFRIIFN